MGGLRYEKMMCAILTTLMLSDVWIKSNKGEPIEVSAREVVDRLQNQKRIAFYYILLPIIAIPVMNIKK